MATKMKHKINSMTLESGVIVDFEDNGKIHLHNKYDHDGNTIKLNSTDLEQIRWQAKRNGEIDAASNGTIQPNNGTIQPNKETVKS